jgi:peptidyl-Lys metalloendopeptidase
MTSSRTLVRFVLAGLAALLICAPAAFAGAGSLSAEIQADKALLGVADDVFVRFTLSNESREDLYVLSWQTALRGIREDIFDVRRDGKPVPYVGRLYKWATPQAADFVRIPAGGSVSARVELSSAYDISRSGEYSIQYRVPVREALRAVGADVAAAKLGQIESNVLSLGIERDERLIAARAAEAPETVAGESLTPGFVSCSSTRQSSLLTATSNAEAISLLARNYLNNLPVASRSTDTAYRTWFGAYTTSRYSTVQSHFNAIYSAFNTKSFTYHCDCTDNAYAYVYTNQPYNVHLCNAFWNAPNLGIDSKAGTLVHEASHFNVVAGTSDYAYGTSACQRLANTNPKKAINNADSHEYFAETR